MSVFKRRRFPTEIILLCVRWYCRYGIRDLEEMMAERGMDVDYSTLYRNVWRWARIARSYSEFVFEGLLLRFMTLASYREKG